MRRTRRKFTINYFCHRRRRTSLCRQTAAGSMRCHYVELGCYLSPPILSIPMSKHYHRNGKYSICPRREEIVAVSASMKERFYRKLNSFVNSFFQGEIDRSIEFTQHFVRCLLSERALLAKTGEKNLEMFSSTKEITPPRSFLPESLAEWYRASCCGTVDNWPFWKEERRIESRGRNEANEYVYSTVCRAREIRRLRTCKMLQASFVSYLQHLSISSLTRPIRRSRTRYVSLPAVRHVYATRAWW